MRIMFFRNLLFFMLMVLRKDVIALQETLIRWGFSLFLFYLMVFENCDL